VLLCVPRSFVNRSGEAVAALLRDTGGTVSQALVVCDDVNLPLGRLRLRGRGSDGGHKGLRSVIHVLGTEEFARLRLGVGRPSPVESLEEYVLSCFDEEDLPAVETMIDRAVDTVLCWIDEGLETAMSRFNAASGGEDS
jgi:PTH1 family peptidyl-tRNA hydrolase